MCLAEWAMGGRASKISVLLAAAVVMAGGAPGATGRPGTGNRARPVPASSTSLATATEWSAYSVPPGRENILGQGGWLASVSCVKPENCVAFGGFGGRRDASQGLLAQLKGRTWKAWAAPAAGLAPPAQKGDEAFVPSSVDCPAQGSCVAVGTYNSTGGRAEGVALEDGDGRWVARTLPLVGLQPPAGYQPHVLFGHLACPRAGDCLALGTYEDKTGLAHSFVEVLSGGSWAPLQLPIAGLRPPAAGSAALRLAGVSCWSPRRCLVVGSYQDDAGATLGYAATSTGGRWRAASLPMAGLAPPAGADPEVELDGTQCPSAGDCSVVGSYRDGSGEVEGLYESLARGRWSAQAMPLAGLEPGPAGTVALSPSRLSCSSEGFCAVVGTYHDLYGDIEGFAETLTGDHWQASTLPIYSLSPLINPRDVFVVDGLACPAAGVCTATGFYGSTANETDGLIEQLDDGVWTAQTAPVGGLAPRAWAFPGVELNAVDCPSLGSCVLVGSYSGPSGLERGLAEVSP